MPTIHGFSFGAFVVEAAFLGGKAAFAVGKQAVMRFADGRERVFEHEQAVGGLAFAPKGLRLGVAHYGGATLYWVGTESPPVRLIWAGAHIGASFSPDARYLMTSMQ